MLQLAEDVTTPIFQRSNKDCPSRSMLDRSSVPIGVRPRMLSTDQNPLLTIETEYGQSIWMDNLSRDLLESGELAKLITTRGVLGITSNPAIFEKAIVGNAIYDPEIIAGIKAGKSLNDIYESLIFTDICHACDILLPVYEKTQGIDGYVSIEVPPMIATDTASTITEARRYHAAINCPNVMIKIPGTPEGLPAAEQMISEGISINVTLLFSVERDRKSTRLNSSHHRLSRMPSSA